MSLQDLQPTRRCRRCKKDVPLSGFRRPDATRCAECADFVYAYRARRMKGDPEFHRSELQRAIRATRRKRDRVRATAIRVGQPWTTPEVNAAMDPSIPSVDVALKFGRTLEAVQQKRAMLKRSHGLAEPIRAAAIHKPKHTPAGLISRGLPLVRPKPARRCRTCGAMLTPATDAAGKYGRICKGCNSVHRREHYANSKGVAR